MSRLVHAGSAVVDYVYRIAALPAPGAEVTAASHARIAGGGFNMMVAARRAGLETVFVGGHGIGPDGDLLRDAMAREGVLPLLPARAERDTGHCIVLVTADAERTFVSWPGAEGFIDRAALGGVALRPGDIVFSSGYALSYPGSRAVLADWIEALPQALAFVFDPAPVAADVPADILARVLARTDWLSCNAAEAECLSGAPLSARTGPALLERAPRASGVLLRSGREGAVLHRRGREPFVLPAFAVEAVDTNGAGDTHIGAFLAALSRGAGAEAALRYAQAAAAIAVTRHGGASAPTHAEIGSFLNERETPTPHAAQTNASSASATRTWE